MTVALFETGQRANSGVSSKLNAAAAQNGIRNPDRKKTSFGKNRLEAGAEARVPRSEFRISVFLHF
jgi:hypothetical protein